MADDQRSRSAGLGGTQLLAGLPDPARSEVEAAARRRTFSDGELVVRQGEPASSLFVVEAGRVMARLVSAAGDEVTLSVSGPGDVVGELGVVLEGQVRTASVRAVGDVVVRELRREDLDRLRARFPAVSDLLLKVLAHRVDTLSRRLLEAHRVPVEKRVARRLFEVGRLFADGSAPVVVPLTQEDVASIAGTTRPTANQVLKALEADGVLRLARGRVELLDIRGLRERCR
ncbi:cAMP-binding domain of CRP or a regulatory subunit of cAMP-dependent protein kinases [Quadrisphaera granulorum]|uniref:CRP-like cAMP-binding protein n=1 Tax=Quadrisphaera granulorum TaxID=317664 RepID=A0A316AB17_9ACTN|nr:Crp/Fnr family transcriptional regulator [Quadrisphaera granulorum]PWJ54609.1 CRP-like cAMP-binding protein [Quadrisphaera granulorum]SZE95971.1 cAMP-binding domain of CRP or a regulatory subunit of cAMP-dependent protein kinases [Quadrisphaera granulorum]